jgi:hypothetical protein
MNAVIVAINARLLSRVGRKLGSGVVESTSFTSRSSTWASRISQPDKPSSSKLSTVDSLRINQPKESTR